MSILSLWEALLECAQSDDMIRSALWDETSLSKLRTDANRFSRGVAHSQKQIVHRKEKRTITKAISSGNASDANHANALVLQSDARNAVRLHLASWSCI